jgi:hypothetical protein
VAQGRVYQEQRGRPRRRPGRMLQEAQRAITTVRGAALIGVRVGHTASQAHLHELDRLRTAVTAAHHLPHRHPARRLNQARHGGRQHRQTQAGQCHAGEPAVSVKQCEDRHSPECAAKSRQASADQRGKCVMYNNLSHTSSPASATPRLFAPRAALPCRNRHDVVMHHCAKSLLLEQRQLVAQAGGLFELQVASSLQHVFFELLDALAEILL